MSKVCFLAILFICTSSVLSKFPIDSTTYENLVRFSKFSAAAYNCEQPFACPGYTLVASIDINSTDTQGYIARDDNKQQIIVVFKGTASVPDLLLDLNITMIPYTDNGCPRGCEVHGGFYQSWSSASSFVMSALQRVPRSYTVIVTGHSLGGSIATLASASILAAGYRTIAYTFGQPRVGNQAFADWMDSSFPAANYHRGTHTYDGVPKTLPGMHHGIEYWQSPDPSSQSVTVECVGQEDPFCNTGSLGVLINSPHTLYFGVQYGIAVCP